MDANPNPRRPPPSLFALGLISLLSTLTEMLRRQRTPPPQVMSRRRAASTRSSPSCSYTSSSSSSSSPPPSNPPPPPPPPPPTTTDFSCVRCGLFFPTLDLAESHILSDPRHLPRHWALDSPTATAADLAAADASVRRQITMHARLSAAETAVLMDAALAQRHVAEVRDARRVLEASGAHRRVRALLLTPEHPARRTLPAAVCGEQRQPKKPKLAHARVVPALAVPPVTVTVTVAVQLVSRLLDTPVSLRVLVPLGVATYDELLALVEKAYADTHGTLMVSVRHLAKRSWIVDYRPRVGEGVTARVVEDADVRRMMEAGSGWVRRMIVGSE